MRKIIPTFGLRWLIAAVLLLFAGPVLASDATLATGDPLVKEYRQAYFTGTGNISASVKIQPTGTQVWEIVSVDLHLSAAGAANNLTITKNSGLGSAYDTLLVSQDMTTVTDLLQTYDPEEIVLQNTDTLDIAWTNGSGRTYGLTVKYKVR